MPNSAITFNTSGLATTTSPGLVGTGAQTFAGKKTLDGGAAIKGDTSGAAIATGYVGEVVEATGMADGVSIGSDAAWSGASLPLSAGIWRIFARVAIGSVVAGDAYVQIRITNNAGTTINNQDTRYRVQNTNIYLDGTICFDTIVRLTGAGTVETYKIYGAKTTVSGSATIQFRNTTGLYSTFYAVRIA